MNTKIKYYEGVLRQDMPEWADEDYALHAIIAKQGYPVLLSRMFIDGKPAAFNGQYVIAEPVNEEDLPIFKKTVLEWAKKHWCVGEEVTEEQMFGDDCENYCDAWFFELEEKFFESLVEVDRSRPIKLNEDENFIQNKYGYCFYSHGDRPMLFNLYVNPEYRGDGNSRKLIKLAISEIRDTGYRGEIGVEVKPRPGIDSERLKMYYKEFGLSIIEDGGEQGDN